jgi:hypothetical protein
MKARMSVVPNLRRAIRCPSSHAAQRVFFHSASSVAKCGFDAPYPMKSASVLGSRHERR